jgi:glutaconate CoA-transferase subunit A
MSMSSGFVDVAPRPMLMTLAEPLDFQTAVMHCGGDDTYHSFYQPGLVTHEVVGSAQVDRFGRTNTVRVTSPSGKNIRLPGQGGMADVANMHQNFVVYLPRHSRQSMVAEVEFVSAARGVRDPDQRRRLNDDHGELELIGINPGVSAQAVQAATGFPVRVAQDLRELAPPTIEELSLIRDEIDPLGMRELEFVSARDRQPLLRRLIDAEEVFIQALLEQPR